MKKYLVILCLIGACCMAFADSNVVGVGNSSDNSKTQVNISNRSEDLKILMDLVAQIKARGEVPSAELYARIEALEPSNRYDVGSLDQGGGNCGTALVVTGASLPYSDSGVLDATDDQSGRPFNDVFYRFTATTAGSHTFAACGSTDDTYLRIWTAGTCGSGATTTSDDVCGDDPQVSVVLTNGQVVYLEFGRYTANAGGSSYTLTITGPQPAPANDDCANSIPVAVPSSTNGSTTNANPDPSAPSCGTASNTGGKGLWYRVTGNDHLLTATTCNGAGTNFDTKIAVYTGSCTGLTCVDGNDDGGTSDCAVGGTGSNFESKVTWCSDLGTVYYILVFGYGASNSGNFRLDILDGNSCHVNCADITPCGAPSETEPNNTCRESTDPFVLDCDANHTVYGTICPASDVDDYYVIAAAHTITTILIFDGPSCATNPATTTRIDLRGPDCAVLGTNQSAGWVYTNDTDNPILLYVDAHGVSPNVGPYRIEVSCCSIRNYCLEPIVVPNGVYTYTHTANTCCASNVALGIWSNGCTGTFYSSGPDIIYQFTTSYAGTFSFNCTGPGSADEQIMVSTTCDTSGCLGSADVFGGNTTGEDVNNLSLPAGTYYVITSYFSNSCGELTVTITGDVPLAVSLNSFDAVPANNSVTLNWSTASETNNNRFDIVRNGETVGSVAGAGTTSEAHSYTWTDTRVNNGTTYSYNLVTVDVSGNREVIGTVNATPNPNGNVAVTDYALAQNYPNPFNPSTDIIYDMKEAGSVSVKVYNLMGQLVATLVNGEVAQGRHTVTFDAKNLTSGVYVYRMEAGSFVSEHKMLLMK